MLDNNSETEQDYSMPKKNALSRKRRVVSMSEQVENLLPKSSSKSMPGKH